MAQLPSGNEPNSVGASVVDQAQPEASSGYPVQPLRPESFDVPRVWSMLRNEPVEDGGALAVQVNEFRDLASLMDSQHHRLLKLGEDLERYWDPRGSTVAETFQSVFRMYIDSIRQDADAYGSTCQALNQIMGTLRESKRQIESTKRAWDQITTSQPMQSWLWAALELNDKAQRILAETDSAIGTIRQDIIVPPRYTPPGVTVEALGHSPNTEDARLTEHEPTNAGSATETSGTGSGSSGGTPAGGAVNSWHPVPAVPGYDPIDRSAPALQGLPNQAALPGLPYVPQPVAVTPGSPISMLPIPPGSPYALGGGAYVLPGPGVGRGGWVYPMPPPSAPGPGRLAGPGGLSGLSGPGGLGGLGGSGTAGMGSIPSSGTAAGHAGTAERRPSRYSITWEVAKGVPPVIGGNSHRLSTPPSAEHNPPDTPNEVFANWFAGVANPWDEEMQADLVLVDVEPVGDTTAESTMDGFPGSNIDATFGTVPWKDRT